MYVSHMSLRSEHVVFQAVRIQLENATQEFPGIFSHIFKKN